VQGNLLVIPIEKSLLYVEPLYLEAAQNSLPTLIRVIVAYNNRIAMAETLDKAIAAIFGAKATTSEDLTSLGQFDLNLPAPALGLPQALDDSSAPSPEVNPSNP
jgi:uncharacterized membrane protein (UPF0182 family)